MPLYTLTEKRLAKRAREDAEGLTELKDMMGLASGSSSGSGSDEESGAAGSEGSSVDEDEDEEMDSEDGKLPYK